MDSKITDQQAAHETTLSAVLTALAGANVIYGLGMLDMGMTIDFTKLVIDNEFAYMIKRAVSGIDVNDLTLAVDIIKEVGPGGEFVSNAHTYQNFKKTQSVSRLINRQMSDDWVAQGSVGIFDKANQSAIDLYENYKPAFLSESQQKEIRAIVNEAEDHYNVEISAK